MKKLSAIQIGWKDQFGNTMIMSNSGGNIRVQVVSQHKDVDARGVSIPLETLEKMVKKMKGE